MSFKKSSYLFCCFIFIAIVSCGDSNEKETFDHTFDRQQMLQDWANLIIVPSFNQHLENVTSLKTAKDEFINQSSISSFQEMKSAWRLALKSWQAVSMFEIGKAEAIELRNFSNIFPCNTELIEENIASQTYNLSLPSNYVAQGFPALDYLFYGISDSESDILNILSDQNHLDYLNDLINRLHDLTSQVTEDWNNTYVATFVNNDGASSTASVDKMVNDFLFYYEKYLRAGKIAIPAGIFSGTENPNLVELPYSGVYAKEMFLEGLKAVSYFFEGRSYDGATNGLSLSDYLKDIESNNDLTDLSSQIIANWQSAESIVLGMNDDFSAQVEADNLKMLETYDELQKAVVLLKVDMMCRLNIQVDYVDADGD